MVKAKKRGSTKKIVATTKEAFLLRDIKLDREDIDDGNRDPYWFNLATIFNDAENQEVNYNPHPSMDEFYRFTFNCSGFIGTSKLFWKGRNDLRGSVEYGLVCCWRLGEIFY